MTLPLKTTMKRCHQGCIAFHAFLTHPVVRHVKCMLVGQNGFILAIERRNSSGAVP